MSKYFLLPLLFIAFTTMAVAQVKDNTINSMMSQRILRAEDMSYNSALLIPRLYKENKMDTIKSIIDYYETNFGSGMTIVPYIIITQIKNKTFKETIANKLEPDFDTNKYIQLTDSGYYKEYIFDTYFMWYLDNYDIKNKLKYPLYIRKAYGDYIEFLQKLAAEELEKSGHTPVEKFLLGFFAHPSETMYAQLDEPEYNGTLLQQAWYKYREKRNTISGFNIGLSTGLWMPQGHLSIVGNHPYIGYVIGGRGKKLMVDLALNFSFLRSPNDYIINLHNVPYVTDYFLGYYIGVDGGYELARKNRHELDVLAGLAFSGFDALSSNSSYFNNQNAASGDASLYSIDFNAGLGYRFYLAYHKMKGKNEHNSYLTIQAKYHYQQYHNDGTNLLGNAWTIGLIYGGYSTKADHYYIDEE